MRRIPALLAMVAMFALLTSTPLHAAAQGTPEISITHTPPPAVTPDHQIYLAAVLTNASSARVSWRNSTMAADGVVPMTNLSRPDGAGWVFAAYLPAQASPTQITYAINASHAGGSRVESYFLSVDVASPPGLTASDQETWILTMAASISMAASTIAVLYWYTGRRLRREGR